MDVRYRLIGPWGHFRLEADSDAEARLEATRRSTPFLKHYTALPHHKPIRLIRVTQEEIPL